MTGSESADETAADDVFLGGRISLRQLKRGHRAGTDAVLLATAASLGNGQCFVDAGAGVGAAGLALAARAPEARGILVEHNSVFAALARHNVELNRMTDRVGVAEADIFNREACTAASLVGCADLVISNPPFYESRDVRASPDQKKSTAHVLQNDESHAAWLIRIASFLRPRGRLLVIHRPDALPQLLGACARRLGSIRIRPVHPRADRPAIRILIGATAGGRGPLNLLPPLTLHADDGRFTPEADALHQGNAMHFWDEKSRLR